MASLYNNRIFQFVIFRYKLGLLLFKKKSLGYKSLKEKTKWSLGVVVESSSYRLVKRKMAHFMRKSQHWYDYEILSRIRLEKVQVLQSIFYFFFSFFNA